MPLSLLGLFTFCLLRRIVILDIIWVEHLLALSKLHRFLNDEILEALEFLLFGERQPLRQIIFVGAQHIFPQFIPQIVCRSNTRIFCKLVYNFIHNDFERGLEI